MAFATRTQEKVRLIEYLGLEWFKKNKLPSAYFTWENSCQRNQVYFDFSHREVTTGNHGTPIGWCWALNIGKSTKKGIAIMFETQEFSQVWQHVPTSILFERKLRDWYESKG